MLKLSLRKLRLTQVDISKKMKFELEKVDDDEINEFLAALSMETGGEISHDDLIGPDSL